MLKGLVEAVVKGDVDKTKPLLVDIYQTIYVGDYDIVQDESLFQYCHITLFALAAYLGHIPILKLFLEQNFPIDYQNSGTIPYESPLNNKKIILEMRKGFTALHAAAWGGQKQTIDFLLEQGADLEARDKQHNDISLYVIYHTDLLNYLLDEKKKKPTKFSFFFDEERFISVDEYNYLEFAITKRNLNQIKKLVSSFRGPEIQNVVDRYYCEKIQTIEFFYNDIPEGQMRVTGPRKLKTTRNCLFYMLHDNYFLGYDNTEIQELLLRNGAAIGRLIRGNSYLSFQHFHEVTIKTKRIDVSMGLFFGSICYFGYPDEETMRLIDRQFLEKSHCLNSDKAIFDVSDLKNYLHHFDLKKLKLIRDILEVQLKKIGNTPAWLREEHDSVKANMEIIQKAYDTIKEAQNYLTDLISRIETKFTQNINNNNVRQFQRSVYDEYFKFMLFNDTLNNWVKIVEKETSGTVSFSGERVKFINFIYKLVETDHQLSKTNSPFSIVIGCIATEMEIAKKYAQRTRSTNIALKILTAYQTANSLTETQINQNKENYFAFIAEHPEIILEIIHNQLLVLSTSKEKYDLELKETIEKLLSKTKGINTQTKILLGFFLEREKNIKNSIFKSSLGEDVIKNVALQVNELHIIKKEESQIFRNLYRYFSIEDNNTSAVNFSRSSTSAEIICKTSPVIAKPQEQQTTTILSPKSNNLP